MFSRWRVPLAAITLMSGSLLVLAAGTASAATASQPGTTQVRPGGAVAGFQPGGPIKNRTGPSPQGKGGSNDAESTNWSGYAVTGGTGAFNSVSASWTEPTATCDDSGTEYSSFWVGLDGYNSSSVEQTGTDADCDSGSPDYYGWYEMYPAYPVYFTNTVQPGDSMSASVRVSGSTYTITLTDNTQGWTQTENETGSGLSDSSAEVITEAPSTESGPLPLADFGTVSYADSTANGESMDSLSPTAIEMVGASGDQLDATSGMDASGDFSNTWMAET